MSVSITINASQAATYVLRPGSWSLQKRLTAESFTCTVHRPGNLPEVDDAVVVHADSDLMFGGRIKSATYERLGGDGPIVAIISCRGYEEIAEHVVISGTLESGPLRTRLYALYQKYLQPKGVTWVGATTGGPDITEITFVRTRLSDVLTRACRQQNHLWRINGELLFAISAPGGIALPVTPMTSSHFLMGSVRIQQKSFDYANRLILQTGGTGEADHVETHTANGVRKYFPLTVEPKASEDDGNGNWTHYHPTSVTVNGTPHTLDGGTGWYYDANEHAVYTTGAAPTAGHHVVTASYKIGFPATLRVYLTEATNSDGTWNFGVLRDKLVNVGQITDVNQAYVWGANELNRISVSPRIVTGSTYVKGFYPLQSGPLLIPENDVSADFLLQNVSISDDLLDPRSSNLFRFTLEFIEGGEPGRQWEELWREFGGQGSGGGTVTYGTGGPVVPPGGGGTGDGSAPIGTVIHLAGDNYNPIPVSTSPVAAPQAIPNKVGGTTFGGTWRLRVPMYQLSAGTLYAQLVDQTTAAVLATVSTTKVAAMLSNDFDYTAEDDFTAPASLDDVILQLYTGSGTRHAVVGHATMVRIA